MLNRPRLVLAYFLCLFSLSLHAAPVLRSQVSQTPVSQAPASQNQASQSQAVQSRIVQTDADGSVLSLSRPAQRIVSLAPHVTDMLVALGAGKQITGVSDDHEKRGIYTRSLSGYPVVADAAALNYEKIMALKPDLIISWGSGTPQAWIAQLRRIGLPVFVLEARKLTDIGQQIYQLGQLTGHEQSATQQQVAFDSELKSLQQRYSAGRRLGYFYQVWSQPLYSLGSDHLLSQGLALCGADNIVPAGPVMAPLINAEFVLTADPDAILFGEVDAAGSRTFWSRFAGLQAVRRQHLLAVDDRRLTRPGPEMLQALEPLCRQLSLWRHEGKGK